MTGRLLVASPEAEIAKHTHLIARLSSGRELRFVDPRRFGRLSVVRQDFHAPGVEPLEVDAGQFVKLFRKRNTPIKSALLNQKLLSGVGNIYADESLFRAGVRPRRRAATLTGAELLRLYHAVKEVLARGDCGGRIFGFRLRGCCRRAGIFSGSPSGVRTRRAAVPGVRHAGQAGGDYREKLALLPQVPEVG